MKVLHCPCMRRVKLQNPFQASLGVFGAPRSQIGHGKVELSIGFSRVERNRLLQGNDALDISRLYLHHDTKVIMRVGKFGIERHCFLEMLLCLGEIGKPLVVDLHQQHAAAKRQTRVLGILFDHAFQALNRVFQQTKPFLYLRHFLQHRPATHAPDNGVRQHIQDVQFFRLNEFKFGLQHSRQVMTQWITEASFSQNLSPEHMRRIDGHRPGTLVGMNEFHTLEKIFDGFVPHGQILAVEDRGKGYTANDDTFPGP